MKIYASTDMEGLISGMAAFLHVGGNFPPRKIFTLIALCMFLAAGLALTGDDALEELEEKGKEAGKDANAKPEAIPIKDGGFEGLDLKAGGMGAWTLSGGKAEQAGEAGGGRQALHLGNENASISQTFDMSSFKGRHVEVSFFARGTGTVACWIDAGAGVKNLCENAKLYPVYMKYVARSKDPVWKDSMALFIGKASDCDIDDVSVAAIDKPEHPHTLSNYDVAKGVPLPQQYFNGKGDIPEGMADIAPYAKIRTYPFVPGANRLVDGYPGSAATDWLDMADFYFDEAQTIASIRICLPSSQILIMADKEGNGKFEPVVADGEAWAFGYWGRPAWPWYKKDFNPPLKARAVRCYNVGHEVQILSPKQEAAKLVDARKGKPTVIPQIAAGAPAVTPEAAPEDRISLGFTIEPWMFNSAGEIDADNNPKRPLKEWDAWKKLLADYKDLKANFMLLFPPQTWVNPPAGVKPKGTYPSAVLWPSNAWYLSCKKNVLAEMCESAHENGIKIFPVFRDYALKDGATVGELNKEMAECGVDAIPVTHDEQAFSAAKAGGSSDDDAFRRAVLKRYDEIAGTLSENAKPARDTKPGVKTFAAFTCTEELGGGRIQHFSENDINGFKAQIDFVGGTSGYFTLNDRLGWIKASYYTQIYRACSPWRQSMHTMNLAWGFGFFGESGKNPLCEDVYPPVAYIGNTLGAVFNKAAALDFWRYNFMDMVPSAREAIKDAFHMADTACAWGAKKATIPRDVLVLRSRASEDWWALHKENEKGAGKEGTEFDHSQWLCNILIRNAFPFELYWQDQPQSYKPVIDKFKAVVLTLPYSVGDNELKALQKAVEANVPVIAVGAKGETDELGDKRSTPALEALIKEGKVQFFGNDIRRDGNFRATEDEFVALLDNAIGHDRRSLRLKRYGDKDVHAAMLEVKPDEKLVLLVNWSMSDTEVDLGLSLPQNNDYKILSRGRKGTSEMSIEGKKLLSDADLRQFRVNLKNGDAEVLRIFR